ncbi:MAG: DUF2062 domain-containing protein [Candidatus Thiodiazotropha sp.]|nr:DUF2062 domain-containing protein [Candidatus Thiodiazotropha taylori]MBT3061379.1 DUF2062 domain-containing protein [Candidatus Thiodiazotropha sp. (ex Lucina pensylvanica)]MBV2096650.1 DUF2062 domain-containing protein [Candidatus Thiodiazotropha sp. (ex Codakia orbicularis)]PUB74840.1 MAG: DUF2062 domain-containing protein [gamma proteobacterium symbiont of Ctena orbiculata]PUB76873.1 MAG: DUF2062 domain-containing protein [gamma proteobacterium symbiont of Ctena orbiculata]
MPKRLIKSLLPHHEEVRNHKHLKLFGSLMHDPNLWHLNRHSVSGAFAVGLFMAFIPLPLQMVFAAAAAIFFRVNLPLSVALVWITNPITIPPMFYFAYLVGTWVTGETATLEPFQLSWEWVQSLGIEILVPLVIGSLICATVSSILGYSLILWIWRWHAVERWKARRLRKKRQGTPSTPST